MPISNYIGPRRYSRGNPNYPLNRSKHWPKAETYKEARERALVHWCNVQHKIVR